MSHYRYIITLFCFFINTLTYAQFSHSGKVLTVDDSVVSGIPVKLYSRVIPNIQGFTSQTNWNGHSYYRSTSSATWTTAKSNCENMGGHLATVSSSSENSFLYGTWPSGWIGLYQDKSGAFYSEPNRGWRWTENEVNDYEHNFDSKNYTTTKPLPDNINSKDATLYNGPTYYSTGGKYIYFDGSNDYAITGDLSGSFPNSQEIQTLQLLCYPQDPGVLVSELGAGNASSGWHESVMEITSSGNLRVGFWNGTSISNIGTTITMNQWHQITMTYDGNTLRGYLDGTYFGAITFNRSVPHAFSGNGLYYCFGKSDATNMGNGTYAQYRLGHFQVYDRQLSDDEIMRNWMHISYRYGRLKYTNWNGGEPNNWGGSEDYIQFVSSGRWNDLGTASSLPYVIEFDYIVDTTDWVMEDSIVTNVNGEYSFSKTYNPSKEYYIEIDVPTTSSTLDSTDYVGIDDVILMRNPLKSYHYHQYDLNNDNLITIGDLHYLSGILNGINTWSNVTWLFTSSQWSTLKNNTTNYKSTIPGTTTSYIFTPTSGAVTNIYLLSKGFTNQSSLNY